MTWAGEVQLEQAANTSSVPAHFLWNSSARNIALSVCWVWKLSPKELCKLGNGLVVRPLAPPCLAASSSELSITSWFV